MSIIKLFMTLFFSVLVQANSPKESKPSENAEVRGLMRGLLENVIELTGMSMTEREFSEKVNENKILNNLTKVQAILKQVEHKDAVQSLGLKISRDTLATQLAETERVFRSGNKSFARWMLNSNLTLCMSCHTQMASMASFQSEMSKAKFKSSFQEAEFLFLSRQYDLALKSYARVVKDYSKGKESVENLEKSLERIVAIYSRVHRDAKGGLQEVQRISGAYKFPDFIKSMLNNWKRDFKSWEREKLPNFKNDDPKALRTFVARHLPSPESDGTLIADASRAVTYLFVSGVLYEHLRVFKKSAVNPEILYWLAQCDRGLNNEFFYSLADLYLKECMKHYSTSPIAKDCFREYKRGVLFSFTGSAGTQVPDDVSADLEHYRKLVKMPVDGESRPDDKSGD